MRKEHQKILSAFLAASLVLTSMCGTNSKMTILAQEEEAVSEKVLLTKEEIATLYETVSYDRTSVHDPSIIVDGNGNYYVFGSHMGVSKSTDLMNWESITSESTTSTLFGNAEGEIIPYTDAFTTNSYTGTVEVLDENGQVVEKEFGTYDAAEWISDNSVSGNMWAPDVIYNETLQKWCMYLSLNGATWNSSIILLTADSIEGPYVYEGPVVFSGFSTADSTKSFHDTDLELVTGDLTELPEKYQKIADSSWGTYWPHAIDPCVFYDDDGELWMSYGSWSGGIYVLKLDKETGLRDYTVTYEDTYSALGASATSDPYFGTKIAGGYYVSGEGSYIQKIGDYYFLFMSYGFYSPDGGYNMRIFRSDKPDGEYVDENGNSAIFTKYIMNYSATNTSYNRGMKLMGNYQWNTMSVAEIAQGHNSAFVDSDGKAYVVYHTKFNDGTEGHQIRTHQLFLNEDGWLVAAPYEYSGESISENGYESQEICGDYELILHKFQIDYANKEYVTPVSVTLEEDGTVDGEYTGTWSKVEGTPYMEVALDGTTYKGVFTKQIVDGSTTEVMCFTAVSSDGVSIWGCGTPADDVVVAENAVLLEEGVPANTYADLTLVTEGIHGASITWASDNESVLSADGTVTIPDTDTVVTLTETISKGTYAYEIPYEVTVKANTQNSAERLLVASYFTDEGADLSSALDKSLTFDNPYFTESNYGLDLSGGVTITFDVEKTGELHMLGTILSFLGNGGDNGRLYFTPGSYLGYNAAGGYFDANMASYALVTDYIGDEANVSLHFDSTGFSVSVNGEVAYTEEILSTDAGAGSVTDYSKIIEFLQETADTLCFGYGSWWQAAGYDEAECTISNVCCYVEPISESVQESEGDTSFYFNKEISLTTASDITYEENPLYGKDFDTLFIRYTINFAEEAAKNGWDGLFSFYNQETGGRVSVQSAPYVCYNDAAGNWIDINQPGVTGGTDTAPLLEAGTDYTITLEISKDEIHFYLDGEEIAIGENGSGAEYEDLLSFVAECDQLTLGVGEAVSAYWNTEICTIKDLVIACGEAEEITESIADTTLSAIDSITYLDNPFYEKNLEMVQLDFTLRFDSLAAKNGWDGVFSFYDSSTGGRVSIQTAPYVCYNDGNGNWMDLNNPSVEGSNNVAATLDTDTDYAISILLTKDNAYLMIDGELVEYSISSSGADFEDLIGFIADCDQFTVGVGQAVTSYWWTELCSLSDITLHAISLKAETSDSGEGDNNTEDVSVITLEKDSISLASTSDITYEENPFYGANLESFYVTYTINFDEAAARNGWDGIFSFYQSETGGRVSFQTAPYICYNDENGNWMDINSPALDGTNAIVAYDLIPGNDYTVSIFITEEEVKMYLNGVKMDITDQSSGVDYKELLSFIAKCDKVTWGVGEGETAYWWTELCTLSNIVISSETPSLEILSNEGVSLDTTSSITYEENPYYGKNLESLYLNYTINWSEVAAKNGWDGLFSFYQSKTGGRVSVSSAPYICYNDGAGNWMDINQPGSDGEANLASELIPGVNYTFTIAITKDQILCYLDGEEIVLSYNGSGAQYSDLLSFITECDQFSYGVGEAETAYWWTELCTLSNIRISPVAIKVASEGMGNVSGSAIGTSTILEAEPEEGYEFVGWYTDNVKVSEDRRVVIEVCKDTEFIAVFQAAEVTVTPSPEVTATPSPEVTVTPSPEVTVTPIPEVTVTPSPEATVTPSPEVTVTPSPEVTATPSPEVTVTPSPEPTAVPSVEPTKAPSVGPTATPTPTPMVTTDEMEVTYSEVTTWEDKVLGALTFKNTSGSTLEEWNLGFTYEGEIEQIWGVVINEHEVNTKRYILEPEAYNQQLTAGESIKILFIASVIKEDDMTLLPSEFELLAPERMINSGTVKVTGILVSSWDGGCCGEIQLTNTGEEAIRNWSLEFDLEGKISSVWGGMIVSQEESHYVIKNASYNSTINAGETVTIGFIGSGFTGSSEEENELGEFKMQNVLVTTY